LRRAPDECTLDFYDDQPVESMGGYVDVGAGRQGLGGCAMTDGERAILDAIDGCDRVVAYYDEALDRFRGRKAQGQLTLRTVPDPPPADTRAALATLRRRLAATNEGSRGVGAAP
jgi:hypothetical protein